MVLTPPIAVLMAAGCSLASALLAVALNNYLSERSRNRDRQLTKQTRPLEFHKTVYPEIFKAGRDLMERSAQTFRDVHGFSAMQDVDQRGKEGINALRQSLGEVFIQAHSLRWILGPSVMALANVFSQKGNRVINAVLQNKMDSLDAEVDDMDTAYDQLTEAVREALYITDFRILMNEDVPIPTLLKSLPDKRDSIPPK